jgi:hypothetical protein
MSVGGLSTHSRRDIMQAGTMDEIFYRQMFDRGDSVSNSQFLYEHQSVNTTGGCDPDLD